MLNRLSSIMQHSAAKFRTYYDSGTIEITHKGAVDLVTQYDIQLEKELTEDINKAFPDFAVVGEEFSESAVARDGKVIYLDPIDGTTSFVHKFPFCGISAGVYVYGEPYCACVCAPVLRETYTAQAGKGAFLNGKKIHVSQTDKPINALFSTGFSYDRERRRTMLPLFGCMLDISQGIRRTGSAALDLCYVARGSFDMYYEIDLKPWDMAAGILIVQEAGGKVSDSWGGKHTLGTDLILATNGCLHDIYLGEIGKLYDR